MSFNLETSVLAIAQLPPIKNLNSNWLRNKKISGGVSIPFVVFERQLRHSDMHKAFEKVRLRHLWNSDCRQRSYRAAIPPQL